MRQATKQLKQVAHEWQLWSHGWTGGSFFLFAFSLLFITESSRWRTRRVNHIAKLSMENIFASGFQLVRLQGLHWQVYLWPKVKKRGGLYTKKFELSTLRIKETRCCSTQLRSLWLIFIIIYNYLAADIHQYLNMPNWYIVAIIVTKKLKKIIYRMKCVNIHKLMMKRKFKYCFRYSIYCT